MTTDQKENDKTDVAEPAETDQSPAEEGSPDTDKHDAIDEAAPDADSADESESDGDEVPEEDIAEVRRELESRLQRLQADFDNFRKRMLKERQEVFGRATEGVLSDLLPVLDHLDLAIEAAESHDADERFLEGFQMVGNQLTDTLGKLGLTALEVEGEVFDTNLHEAVGHMPSEFVIEGSIVKQTRRGYRIGERLLRPAQVIVSSGSVTDGKSG